MDERLAEIEDPGQLELELVTLLETDRYNPDVFSALCIGLESQIQHNWFSTDINLGIIKLIQFYPEQDWDYEEIIVKVLLKTLINLPRPELRVIVFTLNDYYIIFCL